jgi:hypothetical protein
MLYLFLGLVIGYVMGLIHKGIHIHVDKKQEIPKEYNESLVNLLPPEVQQYYHSTNGQNRF